MLPNGDFSAWTVPGCGTGLPRLAGSGNRAGFDAFAGHPDRDEWYIVYHRRPLGATAMGHRQTCIDRMEFDADGFIKPVKMTFEGVKPVRIK